MNTKLQNIDTSPATIIKVLALSIIAFLLNFVNITLYATIHFIFGGVFVVFTILRFGVFWGVVCALISNFATYFLWGHLYGVVYFTLEALFVGCLHKKRGLHVVIGDAIYWSTFGLLFVYLSFFITLEVGQEFFLGIYLKCFLNGLLCSLLGSMMHNAIKSLEHSKGESHKMLPLGHLFFEIILTFILVTAIVFLLRHAKTHAEELDNNIKQLMKIKVEMIGVLMREKTEDCLNDIETFMQSLKKDSPLNHIHILITDGAGRLINKERHKRDVWIEDIKRGSLSDKGDEMFLWMPKDIPAIKAFNQSAYFMELKQINETKNKIFLVAYTSDFIKKQSLSAIYMMSFVLALTLVLIGFALITIRIITKPLQEIVKTSKSIPQIINSGENISLPNYFIYEFDYMAKTIQDIVKELINNYKEIAMHENQLRFLVDERTRELKIARDHYKNITENINDIVYRLILRPKIVLDYINPAVLDVLGYTPDELLGNNKMIRDIVHPDDRRRLKESLFNVGRHDITTLRWISNSGNTVYLEHKNTYNFDSNARLISIEGIARDITERRKLAELFRESAKRFSVLFEQSPNAILIIDMKNGIIMDINTQGEKLFQDKKIAIVGRHFTSILSNSSLNHASNDAKDYFLEKKDRLIYEIVRSDKKTVPVEVVSSVIEIEGRQMLCSVFRDISERKKYEQYMKDALKEKEMLIKEIHHRVKNNMQVILGLISIQASMTDSQPTKLMLSDLESRIKAMAIVHETLYHSEKLTNIDLKEYISKLTTFLNNAYGRADVTLVVSCDDLSIPFEQAIKIGLVLNEMISNAFKHAFNGVYNGLISVQAFRVANNKLMISVADNGVGINEDVTGNTGSLGFQLLHLLVKQLSGEMMIKTGNGTEISITIDLR